jgi:hypothetical protein
MSDPEEIEQAIIEAFEEMEVFGALEFFEQMLSVLSVNGDALVAMGYATSHVNTHTGEGEYEIDKKKCIADAEAAGCYGVVDHGAFLGKRIAEYLGQQGEGDV